MNIDDSKRQLTEEQKHFYMYVHSLIGTFAEQRPIDFGDIVEVLEIVHDEQVQRWMIAMEQEEMESTFAEMMNKAFDERD